MPPKTGTKKSAKSEEDSKKKDGGKGSKKPAEEPGSVEPSASSDGKTGASALVRGLSQTGGVDDGTNREPGVSTSELSHHTDSNRETGEAGGNAAENTSGTANPEVDIKYEEPILPNLIILEFVDLKFKEKSAC